MTNPIFIIIARKMRKAWAANDAARDKDFEYPASVKVVKDISYGTHKKWNLLDLYIPENATESMPCIINIHGGGFFYGDKELYSYYSADLATRGFAVICINYRLSPENRYPAALEDINNVMHWFAEHASEYGIDKNKLFMVGDSAGANLVYNYSTIATNPEYAKLFEFKVPEGIVPKGVGLNCGVYNFEELLKDPQQLLMLKSYMGSKGKIKKNLPRLKIQNFVNDKFPSAYVVSAPNDFVLSEFEPEVNLLKGRGVSVVSKIYGEKDDKNACHVFHLNLKLDIATACNNEECDFFKSLI